MTAAVVQRLKYTAISEKKGNAVKYLRQSLRRWVI